MSKSKPLTNNQLDTLEMLMSGRVTWYSHHADATGNGNPGHLPAMARAGLLEEQIREKQKGDRVAHRVYLISDEGREALKEDGLRPFQIRMYGSLATDYGIKARFHTLADAVKKFHREFGISSAPDADRSIYYVIEEIESTDSTSHVRTYTLAGEEFDTGDLPPDDPLFLIYAGAIFIWRHKHPQLPGDDRRIRFWSAEHDDWVEHLTPIDWFDNIEEAQKVFDDVKRLWPQQIILHSPVRDSYA